MLTWIFYICHQQKKLEDDYRIAQDLLEAREAEITQLSEEIEDVVPQPLPSETIQLQDRCFRLEEQVGLSFKSVKVFALF